MSGEQIKPGYKRTEVGVIPEEWEIRQLSEHFRIYAGGDVPKSSLSQFRSESHPHPIFANALQNNGLYGFTAERRAKADSVTVTARGYLGHAEYRTEEFFPIVRLLVLEPTGSLDARFTTFAINERVKFAFESTGVPQLTAPQIGKYSVAAPPVSEQRAIATALSDVDALLAKLDQLIAKKRDLKQATMQQLLTGQTRLPGFSGEWEMVALGNLLMLKATYGIVTAGDFKNAGVPMVRGGDIKGGQVGHDLPFVSPEKSSEYSRTVLKRDDVIIALVGYPGEAAKVPLRLEGANISRAVGLIRLSKAVTPDYLVSYLNSPIGRRMVLAPSAGSAQLVVNLADLNKLAFPLPSLSEQTAIATVLSDIDTELAELEARRGKTCALKQGMMQELLTGRIRLM